MQADILKIFYDLRCDSATSLLIITHNLAILPDLADRVLVLRGGQAMEEGPLRDVFQCPRTPYTAELLQCAPSPWVQ
jgi:ABC-type dipeptide/oligopeptide/nickel transport system ATPase component